MINPTGDSSAIFNEEVIAAIDKTLETFERAKIVARILTDNGMPVTPPDEAELDDVEWEGWRVCIEIVKALDRT